MEVPLTSLLQELLSKIDTLGQQKQSLLKRVAELESDVTNLKSDLDQCRKECDKISSQRDFLIYSHRLADNPEALALTRRHINTIIRRLNAAIEKLEEDPAI